MTFRIGFYKGTNNWWDGVIRWWDNGPYSHCELLFTDGLCGTAWLNGGVLLRARKFKAGEWDFVELPAHMEPAARKWFEEHKGKSYDFLGLLRFVFDFLRPSRDKWICSRACSDALGMTDGWRQGPNGLHAEVVDMLWLR